MVFILDGPIYHTTAVRQKMANRDTGDTRIINHDHTLQITIHCCGSINITDHSDPVRRSAPRGSLYRLCISRENDWYDLLHNDLLCSTCAYCPSRAMWDTRPREGSGLFGGALSKSLSVICVCTTARLTVRIFAVTGTGGSFSTRIKTTRSRASPPCRDVRIVYTWVA